MWQALINGIELILRLLYDLSVQIGIPSYALAIFFLTLLIKLILYPLSAKQMRSMKKMQEIQPLANELKEKYKNSPEKANKAVLELYSKNKVNPMAGCLPLLIQMPILIALFRTLQQFQYADLGASFFWIPHLKDPDPFKILPVLVALATYFQSRVSSGTKTSNNTVDAQVASTQKTMLYMMPIFIGWMSINFPAGLGLYWVFFSILGGIQQVYINRQPAMQKREVGGKK